jgi:hypothetical protein
MNRSAAALPGDRSDGVGLQVLPHGRRIFQGLKPGPISEAKAATRISQWLKPKVGMVVDVLFEGASKEFRSKPNVG